MRVILITGAASGLGLAFLEHYVQEKDNTTVLAIDRAWPDPLPDSLGLANVYRQTVDITSETQIKSFVLFFCQLWRSLGQSEPHIDLVIHSAGIRGLVPSTQIRQSDDVAKAETLDVMDVATMLKAFEVNVTGTFSLVKHLLPLLQPSQKIREMKDPGFQPSKMMFLGSRMGSMSSNMAGGGYAYRASKAALNAVVKSFSIDVPDVCFVVAHPGRVATGLCDGVLEDGAMAVDQVLPGLVKLIDDWGLKDSGRFVDRFGENIGW